MTLKQRIEQDLKEALLGGSKEKVTILRGVRSAILNSEIAEGQREQGLSDEGVALVLRKEQKKRRESAEVYAKAGRQDRAEMELRESSIIAAYLPPQLEEEEIVKIVDIVINETGADNPKMMGSVMAQVRKKTKGQADGALIARLVKERLES